MLFTPGPLTTSQKVKQAQLRDLGSRDDSFIAIVREIRDKLTALAGGDGGAYTTIPMQGSGTFGLEAVVSSAIPRDGKLLVAINGAYGQRLARMAEILGVAVSTIRYPEYEAVDPEDIAHALGKDPGVTHVAVCHCETTSGVMNPVEAIGAAVSEAGRVFFVDAMSSFGAVELDVQRAHVDYLVSSANKCIEGVPGFSFIIANLQRLQETAGYARSLSLDLLGQYQGLEKSGQFRFTPPTHAILAFHQALTELEGEGGVVGRAARYRQNHATLMESMRGLGFTPYLAEELQSYIITTFLYPDHPNFEFESFYRRLKERGCVIYPGKLTAADCFRIGTIGRIFPADIEYLVASIEHVMGEMGISLKK